MASTESKTAVIPDNKAEEVDKITDVEKTESSADGNIDVPSPPPQSKRVWLRETHSLYRSLLSSFSGNSRYKYVSRLNIMLILAIVATALPRTIRFKLSVLIV